MAQTIWVVYRHQLSPESEARIQANLDGIDFNGTGPVEVENLTEYAAVPLCECKVEETARLIMKALAEYTFDYDHYYSISQKEE